MVRTSVLTALCIILLGFGVPAISIYSSVHYGFNFILAGLISILALIIAGVIAVVGIALGFRDNETLSDTIAPAEREKLDLLRADERATLEELDDIVVVLKEIRDVLKSAHE